MPHSQASQLCAPALFLQKILKTIKIKIDSPAQPRLSSIYRNPPCVYNYIKEHTHTHTHIYTRTHKLFFRKKESAIIDCEAFHTTTVRALRTELNRANPWGD